MAKFALKFSENNSYVYEGYSFEMSVKFQRTINSDKFSIVISIERVT